ncbi:hypothetical protein [Candidatus Stoquefichus massiliensis]|uniref:hypothetical protein n=1 Tax=Candidatus Stoquefichus massiliensis TaxID=1470350 RepID=UPI00047FE53F|nr:hypothetical protein [Candidatus Stoquefichus massiliensis]
MKKIILVILISLTGLSLSLLPKLCKSNKVNIDNHNSVIDNILQLKGYTSINIVKEKRYKDYYAILYYKSSFNIDNSKKNLELSIYKKLDNSKNNYDYYGGASSTKDFDTFNCNDRGQETIIIVYGDNQLTNASSYCIKSSQNLYKKNIESDLILDIYIIYDTNNCSSVNELLDINGEIIKMF